MPIYEFRCKCGNVYESLVAMSDYDETGKYPKVKCPECKSAKKAQLVASPSSASFVDPRGTSKFDNFGYRAGFNMEKAKEHRRFAEEKSHVGGQPYRQIFDDIK